jgi:hypothetical protein
MARYRGTTREIVMASARKKKANPARKRAAKRSKTVEQSQSNWQIGAGMLALAVLLGVGVYMVSTNDSARTSVANFVDRIEVPQSVKDLPETVRQNLPEMPSLTHSSESSSNGSAPASR